MLASLEAELGPYADALNTASPNDRLRTKFAIAIIKKYKPNLMTVHLTALDHEEHVHGPFSREANEALEASDEMVGQLRDAALSADPDAIVCVVSDHGFAPVTRRLNLVAAFTQAGLIQAPGKAKTMFGTPIIESWEAMPWPAGGSAAVVLKDPQNQALVKKTGELLRQLAADPQNGIAQIVDKDELAKLGGYPTASFLVDLKPGYQADFSFSDPVTRDSTPGGTHGYLPSHPELRASFFLTGPGIARGRDLGVIDMRQIAPTLSGLLGLSLPSADGKPLTVR
jgi:predicted AlkP superfamily pyrophosphatase or phosphodiesterase